METDDVYKKNFFDANIIWNKILSASNNAHALSNNPPTPVQHQVEKVAPSISQKALPKLKIPSFNGSVAEWLPLWSQFTKYHDDPLIEKEVKFQYLLQATTDKSKANDIVNSFAPTGGNYDKVISSLKNRFGRDDLVSQYYIRQLLVLVTQNAANPTKPNVADLMISWDHIYVLSIHLES